MEAPLDPGSILSNAGRLRQLARALVRDEHLADDLVQDTWLAWLRRPGDPRAPDAWLSRVLRNLAVSSRRRETARRRREESRAAREIDPREPAGSLERFETLKAVVEMVADLEEPGRSTVILHFFDGLTLADVADRHGVSRAAARLRLKVALEKLRGRLDRRFGRRAAWALILSPFLAPGDLARAEVLSAAAPAREAAVSKALGGALSMSVKKVSLSIAASILVLLGMAGSWLALRSPEPPDSPPGGRDAVATLPRDSRPRPDRAPGEDGAGASLDARAPAAGPIAIEGRVTAEEAGLAGARIVALSLSRWDAVAEGLRDERSGEDARARLEEAYRREAASAPEELSGREGRFTFRGLERGSYRLLASHPERLPSVDTIVTVSPAAPARCEIELAAAAAIRGEVRDELGAPVPGAAIEAETAETAQLRGMALDLRRSIDWSDGSMLVAVPRAMSDAKGVFRLGPLEPEPHALRASHASFAVTELLATPGHGPVTIVLRRGAGIAGRALTVDGRPASGARARLSRIQASEVHRLFDWSGSDRGPAEEAPREVRTAADGMFRIEGLSPGIHELELAAAGHALFLREIEIQEGLEDMGDLRLEEPLGIAGRVLAPDGKPVAGARVRAGQARRTSREANAIDPPGPPPLAETESDAAGRFALSGLPAGRYEVEADADGFAPARIPDASAGESDLDLVLEEGLTVHGKVVDGETLAPVAGVEVDLSLRSRFRATTDAKGLFVVRGYPRAQGRYGAGVTARHPDYGSYSAHSVTVLGRTASSPLEVRLGRAGREIRGRVLDGSGRPVPGAQVWVEPPGAASYSTPGDRTASGEDGSFRLPEPSWLLHGREFIEVGIGAFHPSHAMGRAGPFPRPSTGEPWPDVEIVLDDGVSLEGTVTGSDGSPIAGARVTAGPPSAGGRDRKLGGILGARSTLTDASGAYRLQRLQAGDAEIVARAPGRALARIPVVVGPGATRRDIVLEEGAPIRGRVLDEAGEPLEDVQVTAVEDDSAPPEFPGAFQSRMDLRGRAGIASARTDGDGRYEVPHLAPGAYTVIARATGYEAAESGGIRAGESAPDIVLPRFSALRGVVVGPDGAPVTAFTVDAIDRAGRAGQEERGDWRVGSQGEVGFSDVHGRFIYDGLRAGEYDIVVQAPGFLAFRGEAEIEAGQEARIEVRLARGGRLEGTLRDAVTGRPVPDALVNATRQVPKRELEAMLAERRSPPMSPPSAHGHTWSGAGGEWSLDGLLDGEYAIWVTHPYALKATGRVELLPGGTARLDLALEPCGRFEGTLAGLGKDAPREPGVEMHYSIEVELLGASAEEARSARRNGEWQFPVDRSGSFQAQGLRPGTYRIELGAQPYRQGRFQETGPGWGTSRPETAGPKTSEPLGEVEVRAGETAVFHGKAPDPAGSG